MRLSMGIFEEMRRSRIDETMISDDHIRLKPVSCVKTAKKSIDTLAMGNIDRFRFNLRIFCIFCHFCTKLGLRV